MLRSSRHPYQATAVPQAQLHVRNPWVDQSEPLTHNSCMGHGGRGARGSGPPPASEWLLPRHPTASQHGPLLNQQVHPVVVSSREPGSVAVSTVHGSSAAVSVAGGIDSCGGQCVACETFCYYCLQVLFIVGILTGISLTIAGSVLRGSHRGGDLMVLVYIGVLLALVCGLLLSVHCCVRRKVKERKRALRLARIQGPRHLSQPSQFTSIPMQDFAPEALPSAPPYTADINDPCYQANVNEFGFIDDQRSVMNIIPNPTFHSHIRPGSSNRSSISRGYSHERRYAPDPPDRHLHDWDRQPYQPMVHRTNR